MTAAERLAEWLRESDNTAAMTGAGVSTESGIPDFRSPGGIWTKMSPVLYQDFLASEKERKRYWYMRKESYPAMREARPNRAHTALAELHSRGLLSILITQNIDGLHQAGGMPQEAMVEIHGTARTVFCLGCSLRIPGDEVYEWLLAGEEEPRCRECGGILKSATVSFGEGLPQDALRRSQEAAESCDLFLVFGSSLVVEPAASIPVIAKRRGAKKQGAKLAIVNLGETPLDSLADLLVRERCGDFMGRVMEALG